MTVLSHMTLLMILAQQQPSPVQSEFLRIEKSGPQWVALNSFADPQVSLTVEEPEPVRKPGTVLVILKSRRHTLTVYKGQRFGVASDDGKVLAGNIGVKELQKRFPSVYQNYRWSYAEAWAGTDFGGGEGRFGTSPPRAR